VPSGQLFVGGIDAGSVASSDRRILRRRAVSYTIYVTGASAIKDSFGDEVIDSLTSPLGLSVR
jgi:hypothetical protein